jgi:BirA family biotin operon repressor/biotin-[acetyl-CoA-carboxylase] ligase
MDDLAPKLIEAETPNLMWPKLQVEVFPELGSTNDEAAARARSGAPQGTLVLAEMQTAGRGRKGRAWVSHPSAGLYFSLVLRPEQPQNRWPLLGHAAALALVRVLKQLPTELPGARTFAVDLKWPNDVLITGKKVSGILMEAGGGAAVIGMGINFRKQGIPPELDPIATCLDAAAGRQVPRRWLLVRVLSEFQLLYGAFERGGFDEIIEEWKQSSSMWDEVPVWIIEGESSRPAIACGITEDGALRIRRPDGAEEVLLAGDVSLRVQ